MVYELVTRGGRVNLPVTVVMADEKLDAMEEDREEAAVTGQMVVY